MDFLSSACWSMLNRPGFCGGCLVKEGHHLKPVWRLASSIVPQLLPGRLSGIQGLFQRIQNEIRLHGLADSPAHDAPGKYINDESHIHPPLPSRYIIIGGGALLLRFNGSKWTQVFAEKYLGYAVSVGIKLFALYLIVGLGQNLANTWVTRLGASTPETAIQVGVAALIYGAMGIMVPGMAGSMLNGSPSNVPWKYGWSRSRCCCRDGWWNSNE